MPSSRMSGPLHHPTDSVLTFRGTPPPRFWRRPDGLRSWVSFALVGMICLSGYGTLIPGDIRCGLPGGVNCPGGILGPAVPRASPGNLWFDVTAYDYGFWIVDTTNGVNETSTWTLYESWTIHVNATSLPPNPAEGGTAEHGVGIYSNSAGNLLSLAAPVGSWAKATFSAPSAAETGDEIYCTIYCGPGHSSQHMYNIDVVAAPSLPKATATATPTTGAAPLTVNFTGAASGGTSPYSFSWTFGDGSPASPSQNPSHVYTTTGTYTAVLTVTDAAGNTGSASVAIGVNAGAPLTAHATASPSSGSVPLNVAFNATASGGSAPYSYTWAFGDGGTGSGAAVSHTYTAVGTYTATVTVKDGSGGSTTATAAVTVSSAVALGVSVSASPTSGAAPLAVTFTVSPSGGTAPYSAAWTFGDGTSGQGLSTSHTYSSGGNFVASVVVTDSAGHSGQGHVDVNVTGGSAPLSAVLAVSPLSGPDPLTVNASASALGGTGPYTYSWTFDSLFVGTGPSVSQTLYTAGSFPVTVTITDSTGKTASATQTVVVTGPTLTLTLTPARADSPALVTATASVQGGSGTYKTLTWVWGDGTSSTGASPTHAYDVSTATTFTVHAYTNDSYGNGATGTAQVTVYGPLTAGPLIISDPSPTSVPANVSFSLALQGGTGQYGPNYTWRVLDNASPTLDVLLIGGTTERLTFNTTGNYSVEVSVADSLGTTINRTGSVNVSLSASGPGNGGSAGGGGSAPTSTLGNGIGDPNTTALALLGLMALVALYLLWSGVESRKSAPSKRGASAANMSNLGSSPPRRSYPPS